MPLVLRDHMHLASNHHWYIYLPVMVLSLIVMVPMVIIAEKRRRMKQTLVGAVVTLAIAELVFWRSVNSLDGMIIGLLLFFTAFNVMEAILPSYIAKVAPPDKKGSAMGAYSTSQFLGAFAGGAIGGWLYGAEGLAAVFAFCALAAVLWAFIASTLHQPPYLSSKMLNVGTIDDAAGAVADPGVAAGPRRQGGRGHRRRRGGLPQGGLAGPGPGGPAALCRGSGRRPLSGAAPRQDDCMNGAQG